MTLPGLVQDNVVRDCHKAGWLELNPAMLPRRAEACLVAELPYDAEIGWK
jgi:hypothetical protein